MSRPGPDARSANPPGNALATGKERNPGRRTQMGISRLRGALLSCSLRKEYVCNGMLQPSYGLAPALSKSQQFVAKVAGDQRRRHTHSVGECLSVLMHTQAR